MDHDLEGQDYGLQSTLEGQSDAAGRGAIPHQPRLAG